MSKNGSIDGFVPRRRGGDSPVVSMYGLQPHAANDKEAASVVLTPHAQVNPTRRASGDAGLSRSDIDQSLGQIDTEEAIAPVSTRHARRARKQRAHPRRRKIIIWSSILVAAIILGLVGFLALKAMFASNSIFKGSIFGILQHQELKMDENGRSNIIVFGTSEDDGPDHGGAYLTDSMMVVSIDQKKHTMYTFNIPRDLWVKYGEACDAGYEGKINAIYECYSNNGQNEQAGTDAIRKAVGEVTGLDIQYYVHVNYTVLKDAVNAVGGVDVDVEGDGPVPYGVQPGSILDRNFDWNCKYKCYYVKYSPGVHHLDGIHALYLARARGDTAPTYGLQRANFDREVNQQKIVKALLSKTTSGGTLTNYGAVTSLLDTFGANLRTNFQTSEIQTLLDIAKNTPSSSIQSISLIDANPAILTTDNISGQSIVRPVTSLYDYSPIASYLSRKLSSDPSVGEGAIIGVFNGSGASGAAQKVADALTSQGLTVNDIDNSPSDITAKYAIYDLTNGQKPATIKKLEAAYGVKAISGTPGFSTTGLDIVIIVGPNPSSNQSTSTQ